MAVAAAAAEYANKSSGLLFDDAPPIRVIGWIHTHPGIGLFLSGTDISTYKANLDMSPDGRFVAVVVDPLRNEDGVFPSPDRPNDHSPADGAVVLENGLRRRYLKFLSKMEEIRAERGREALPFIMCGDLRGEHVAAGNPDDHVDSYLQSVNVIRDEMRSMHERLEEVRIGASEAIAVVSTRISDLENILAGTITNSTKIAEALPDLLTKQSSVKEVDDLPATESERTSIGGEIE